MRLCKFNLIKSVTISQNPSGKVLKGVIDDITDFSQLAFAIFSRWGYFADWAMEEDHIPKDDAGKIKSLKPVWIVVWLFRNFNRLDS